MVPTTQEKKILLTARSASQGDGTCPCSIKRAKGVAMVLDLGLDMDSACVSVPTVHTYADNTNNT
jgi:hypothetical protein